jgi:hypothetical protein
LSSFHAFYPLIFPGEKEIENEKEEGERMGSREGWSMRQGKNVT